MIDATFGCGWRPRYVYLLDYYLGIAGKSFGSLKEFAQYIVTTSTAGLPAGSKLNNSLDSINMYFVNGTGRGNELGYKAYTRSRNGWMRTPDVKVAALTKELLPILAIVPDVKLLLSGELSLITDRYGQHYLMPGGNIGVGISFGGGYEGWVVEAWS